MTRPEQNEAVRLAAEILQMTGCCEKSHRKGILHFHEETVHRWGQRLARIATTPPAAPPALHTDRCGLRAQQDSHDLVWECDPSCPATPPPATPPTLREALIDSLHRAESDPDGYLPTWAIEAAVDEALATPPKDQRS